MKNSESEERPVGVNHARRVKRVSQSGSTRLPHYHQPRFGPPFPVDHHTHRVLATVGIPCHAVFEKQGTAGRSLGEGHGEGTVGRNPRLVDGDRTVVVGERAMVGAKAVVLPGVEIGPDAQVAAGSLVTEDVPEETTVAGVPATPVEREGDGRGDDT